MEKRFPARFGHGGETLSLAIAGDTMITRPLSIYNEENYLALIEILRSNDIAYTNFEMLLHNYTSYPLKSDHIGTYMRAHPSIAEELIWAGFNLVSCANNHAGDFGPDATLETIEHLEEAGLVHAGTGKNLSEAREPKCLDTAKGRIALISICSTFKPYERASKQKGVIKGRPGLNPLRFKTKYEITEKSMEDLRDLSESLDLKTPAHIKLEENDFYFLGNIFVVKEEPNICTLPDQRDVQGNIKSIKDSRSMADWTLVAFHSHESGGQKEEPANFMRTFSRDCIEAGADIIIGHGSHVLRGIEIYKGKPIFYSLGNFVGHNEYVERLPSDAYEIWGLEFEATAEDFHAKRFGILPPDDPAWWESIVATIKYEKRVPKEILLYPITLGYGSKRPTRGRPMLADLDLGNEILEHLSKLSTPFGTEIQVEKGVGKVKL